MRPRWHSPRFKRPLTNFFSVVKIKKDLIHKAKVKKAYAKIKAREEQAAPSRAPAVAEDDVAEDGEKGGRDVTEDRPEKPEEAIHPTRQLMLKDEDKAQAGAANGDEATDTPDGQRRRTRRPGYYDKQLRLAEERRAEAEQRQQEMKRRREERERKLAERDRFKKAMAKTRGRDGKKKLGRESTLLLDKVKRLVGDQ